MLFLAASALDTVKQLPMSTWVKIAIALASIIVVVILLRKIAATNKVVLGVVVFVVCTVVFFSWVYNRNEPKFLSPIIDRIAPFFPSAGSYNAKQQSAPKP
jgi:glucan phosphoethanolaminetransferase (alkaline phosphatase superfamily)